MRRNDRCIHVLAEWPRIKWDDERLINLVGTVRYAHGCLAGRAEAIDAVVRQSFVLGQMTRDSAASAALDDTSGGGGLERAAIGRSSSDVGGPLAPETLWRWHGSIFPNGR